MRMRLLALALTLPILGACATKKDLRELRTEMESLRSSQDAILREIQRQNQLLLDTLSIQDVRMRGDLSNRLLQIERQLVQVQELTGQGQQRLGELRQQLRSSEEALRAATAASQATSGGGAAAAGDPEELFSAARAALERGSVATARANFEEFVGSFPRHPRAAEAQLAIGETFEKGNDPGQALEKYQQVVELYPDSPSAATALYRAARIEGARNNRDRARAMFNQVVAAYPQSPEATSAKAELGKMRR